MSLSDRAMRGYDAWVTREPDYGPEPPLDPSDPDWPRCEAEADACGAPLQLEPDDSTSCWYPERCDGRLHEPFGTTPCGEDVPHEAHFEVVAAWDVHRRVCRTCGRNNYQVV